MPKPLLRLLSADEEKRAASALGAEHPLVHSLAVERVRLFQIAVTSIPILLGIAGIVRHEARAPVVLGAAALVELGLLAAIALAHVQTRDHARVLIAAGLERIPLRAVDRERRALASCRRRKRLARSLERHLRDAERWEDIVPHARPLVDIRRLRFTSREAREVVTRLRSRSPSVRGVAAALKLLTDSRSSPLFAGEVHELRSELVRIAELLDANADEERAAA